MSVNKDYSNGYNAATRRYKRPEGSWKLHYRSPLGEGYTCTKCKRQVYIAIDELVEQTVKEKYPYCHCGAEMTKVLNYHGERIA